MKIYIAGLVCMLLLAAAGAYSWYRSAYAGQDTNPDELVVQSNFPPASAANAEDADTSPSATNTKWR